jgi:hypothetical protein
VGRAVWLGVKLLVQGVASTSSLGVHGKGAQTVAGAIMLANVPATDFGIAQLWLILHVPLSADCGSSHGNATESSAGRRRCPGSAV